MTTSELQRIEDHVGFRLPSYYRETLLQYPFPRGSFAEEFLLPDCPEAVLDLNDVVASLGPGVQALFIGNDGGEERYFVDASQPDSGVFVMDSETGRHRSLTTCWSSYLEHIRATHAELAEDERVEEDRSSKKKWWKFW